MDDVARREIAAAAAGSRESSGVRPWQLAANLVFGLLVLALIVSALAYAYLQIQGWRFYTIASSSMEPALGAGDVVLVREIAPHEVKHGDIIAYNKPGFEMPIVHRVVAIESAPDVRSVFQDREGNVLGETIRYSPRTFTTQGDANAAPDAPVSQDQLIGISTQVVGEPLASSFVFLNRGNLILLGALAVAAFVVWEGYDLVREALRRRRDGQAGEGPAGE